MNNLEEDKFFIAELFDAQPESVIWLKPIWDDESAASGRRIVDFEITYCNNTTCKFLRAGKKEILGKRLLTPPLMDLYSVNLIFEQSVKVFETGEPEESSYFNPYLGRNFNVLRSKVKEGVLTISRDHTKQHLLEKQLEQQANRFNTIINSSADGILLLEAVRDDDHNVIDFKITHSNQAACHLGKIPAGSVGKSLFDILPHLRGSEQFEMHRKVVETGTPLQFETTFRNEQGLEYGWFIASLSKLDDGILSRFVDISEKKENEKKIEKQAEFLNSILEASINGVFVCEAVRDGSGSITDLEIQLVNKSFTRLLGLNAEEVEGKSYLSFFPSAKGSGLFELNTDVIETGKPVQQQINYVGEGVDAWYDISMVKLGENSLVVTFSDITKNKIASDEIEQNRNLLSNILKYSPSGISVTEVIRNDNGEVIDGRTILANDAAIKYIRIPKEDYLTKTVSEIDPKLLESPLYKMSLNALETGASFITQYYFEVFGRWLEVGVSKMDDDHLVNVFTDVTDIKESQIKLEKLVEELRRSNAHLEEFTYAASHDLKEPIRKISIFATRLKNLYSEYDSQEGARTLERLQVATERMQLLIDDLLDYSHVSTIPAEQEEVNLNEKLQKVIGDLELVIEEKKAKIHVGPLPTIRGYRRQLQQLFQNLLSNSLKYVQAGVAPEISITSQEVEGADIPNDVPAEEKNKKFYLVEVKDNGIGFEQQYADRIFNMFQRLHGKSEYSGTGVGLSIARKVAENHNGYIFAYGEPLKGATFKVYLPK